MTQNPYAQFGSNDGVSPYGPDFGDQPQPRTSILAIVALVLSIVGCVCFVLPGPGAIAMILGGAAILMIMMSGGRVRGIGIAATAVCLGLLQSIIFFVLIFGVYQPIMGTWSNTVIAPVSDIMTALEKKDTKAARAVLTPRAQAGITEEMLADFAAAYQGKLGAFKGMPRNGWEIYSAYSSIAPAMRVLQTSGGGNQQQNIIPLPGFFEKGNALMILHMDARGLQTPPAGSSGAVRMPVLNIGIITNDGMEYWMLDQQKANALPAVDSDGNPEPKKGTQSTIQDAPPDAGKTPAPRRKP